MTSHTDALFDRLSSRGYDPALRNRTATIRFEISDNDHVSSYSVAVDKGEISVTSPGDPAAADCTLRSSRALFDEIAGGETNAMAAMLRGDLFADGDPELLIAARKLVLDGPASTKAGARS